MPSAICIPRLGWNMEEGVFLGWLRGDGEPVAPGQPLFAVETDKAAQEVEAEDRGVLWIDPNGPAVGDVVKVGTVIGSLLPAGASPPVSRPEPSAAPAEPPAPPAAVAETVPPLSNHARPGRDRPRSSPLARRLARELKVDWTRLQGSGRSGRVRKVDVLAAAGASAESTTPSRSIPIGPRRRTIAARMVESRSTTAPVTLTTTVDATNLVNLRGQFRAADAARVPVPSVTDFVVKLTALALLDHPRLNARWEGDRIEVADGVHVGVAVDTDAGLIVPVVRDAHTLGLRALAARSRELIERARAGTLTTAEVRGGTFTVTNLGAYGVEAFTPIINLPECAVLGVGRIARAAAAVGDRVEPRDRLTLSLTFDHRVVDGAPAARFLQDVGRRIENPGPWLLS